MDCDKPCVEVIKLEQKILGMETILRELKDDMKAHTLEHRSTQIKLTDRNWTLIMLLIGAILTFTLNIVIVIIKGVS
jgi:hypothetical protein